MGKIGQISLLSNFKILVFLSALLLSDWFWTNLKMCLQISFLAKSLQKTVFICMRNYKEIRRGLKVFIFWPYGFENGDFWKMPSEVRWSQILNGPIWKCAYIFFWPNHFKKTVFISMRNYKEIGRGLKIFIFRPYGFENGDFWKMPAEVYWSQILNGSSTWT